MSAFTDGYLVKDRLIKDLETQLAEARDENENLKKYWQPEEIEASKARATEMRLKLFGEQVVAERITTLQTQHAELKEENLRLLKRISLYEDK